MWCGVFWAHNKIGACSRLIADFLTQNTILLHTIYTGGPWSHDWNTWMDFSTTYSYSLISIIHPDVVSLPRDCGLRMASRGDALHDSWLTCCYHYITGRLTEIISQNWGKEERCRGMVRVIVNLYVDDTMPYVTMHIGDIGLISCWHLVFETGAIQNWGSSLTIWQTWITQSMTGHRYWYFVPVNLTWNRCP